MKKKISKRKQLERENQISKAKRERIILTLSFIPAFAFTAASIITYAVNKYGYLWLSLTTAFAWLITASVFLYATKKHWGFANKKGVVTDKSTSVVTVYNTVLLFALSALFFALFIKDLIV